MILNGLSPDELGIRETPELISRYLEFGDCEYSSYDDPSLEE